MPHWGGEGRTIPVHGLGKKPSPLPLWVGGEAAAEVPLCTPHSSSPWLQSGPAQ